MLKGKCRLRWDYIAFNETIWFQGWCSCKQVYSAFSEFLWWILLLFIQGVLSVPMGILMHQLYSLKASFFTQCRIPESPHDFISIVLRLATGLALSSLEIQWHLSFFQQTNASQHEDWWRSHFKFSSCEGGKGSSKGKEARLCVSTAESLRTCDWCCHFLCKAPQQPKGSVGRLFLACNQLVNLRGRSYFPLWCGVLYSTVGIFMRQPISTRSFFFCRGQKPQKETAYKSKDQLPIFLCFGRGALVSLSRSPTL